MLTIGTPLFSKALIAVFTFNKLTKNKQFNFQGMSFQLEVIFIAIPADVNVKMVNKHKVSIVQQWPRNYHFPHA